jgi:Fe-Mn family superoxide dismutase
MAYKLPALRFAYDALEPHIDAETMELHHDKHHQLYVDNVNKAIEPYPHLADLPIEDLLGHLDRVPETIRVAVPTRSGEASEGARTFSIGHHGHLPRARRSP